MQADCAIIDLSVSIKDVIKVVNQGSVQTACWSEIVKIVALKL